MGQTIWGAGQRAVAVPLAAAWPERRPSRRREGEFCHQCRSGAGDRPGGAPARVCVPPARAWPERPPPAHAMRPTPIPPAATPASASIPPHHIGRRAWLTAAAAAVVSAAPIARATPVDDLKHVAFGLTAEGCVGGV